MTEKELKDTVKYERPLAQLIDCNPAGMVCASGSYGSDLEDLEPFDPWAA